MSSLSGTTPAATYGSLIKFDNNSPIGATLRLLSDGAGGATPIYLSSTQMNLGGGTIDARLGIKGTGTTSATFSLWIQNSAGVDRLLLQDNGDMLVHGGTMRWSNTGVSSYQVKSPNGGSYLNLDGGSFDIYDGTPTLSGRFATTHNGFVKSTAIGQITAPNANSILELVSTTKGFLPPRMTTTQVNAIVTPTAGLTVYNTTLNVLCCYNGTGWFRVSMATAM